MLYLANRLDLDSCPHCAVDRPNLSAVIADIHSADYLGGHERIWRVYSCARCGGQILAGREARSAIVTEIYPKLDDIDESIPEKAREYLRQAVGSLKTPAGAVMLAACAVDAMLKDKGYKDGSLKSRIDTAAEEHLITADMAAWAHEVRLDANDQRHADEEATLPDEADASRVVTFAQALGTFMFVLPARVARGREEASPEGAGAPKP